MHRRLEHFLWISYCTILISSSLIAVIIPKSTDTSIAAYDRYVTPTWKTTKSFDPQYAYRFHPNDQQFTIIRTAHKKIPIIYNKPNPRYHTAERNIHIIQANVHRQQNVLKHDHLIQIRNKRLRISQRPSFLQRLFHIKTRQQKDRIKQRKLVEQLNQANRRLNMTPKKIHIRAIKTHSYQLELPPRYRITNDAHQKLVYLHANYPIWSRPYRPGLTYSSSTNRLARDDQAMIIKKRAVFRHHYFYLIESSNNTYGWVPSQAIKIAHTYMLPFQYYSQLYPTYAPDACEVVALRMALSIKGYDPSISMQKYIDRVPRNHDPEKGYNASPFKMGDNASIYPKALAAYGRRYDKKVYAFTGITEHRVISEIEHGNPVVFEGAYRMRVLDSDHTLVLVGYSHGDLEFADPFCRKSDLINNKPISWVSMRQFEKMFHQSFRGARAVVVK